MLLLTDARQSAGPLLETVASAIDGGARTVVVREKHLPMAERLAIGERIAALLAPHGGTTIVAGALATPPAWAAGVHLSSADPVLDLPDRLVGRSCHSAADLRTAAGQRVSYATISPVYLTASKPGYGPALGTAGLAALCAGAGCGLPVYALGGIERPRQAVDCLRAGASGIAVMGAVMRAENPAATVAALLDAIGSDHHVRC